MLGSEGIEEGAKGFWASTSDIDEELVELSFGEEFEELEDEDEDDFLAGAVDDVG